MSKPSGGLTPLRIASLLIALAACGTKREEDSDFKPTGPDPMSTAVTPTPPAPMPVPIPPPPANGLKLPSSVGLPDEVENLKPFMRRKDALAACAGLSPTSWTVSDVSAGDSLTTFKLQLGRVVSLAFTDDRLTRVAVADRDHDALVSTTRAAWGAGTNASKPGDYSPNQAQYDYAVGASGWSASVMVFPGPELKTDWSAGSVAWVSPPAENTVLVLDAATAPTKAEADTAEAAPTDKVLANAAALIGGTLENAQKNLGDDMRIESGDDEAGAAESTAEKQGYARMPVPWNDEPWEATLHVNKKTKRIDVITFQGSVADGSRKQLFGALSRDFGAPKPEIDDEGNIGILYTTPRVTVYTQAGVEALGLSITAR